MPSVTTLLGDPSKCRYLYKCSVFQLLLATGHSADSGAGGPLQASLPGEPGQPQKAEVPATAPSRLDVRHRERRHPRRISAHCAHSEKDRTLITDARSSNRNAADDDILPISTILFL